MKTIKRGDRGGEVKTLQRALNLVADGIFGEITEEAVKAHQRKYGLADDGIVGARTWATIPTLKSTRPINEIIVHCTATPAGRNVTVEEVRAWHKKRGFADIGYHYLVYIDGSVHKGRSLDKVGAHCTGHNARSIGVCYVGGLDAKGKAADTRTEAQKAALFGLLRELKAVYPKATIHGHKEYAPKDCPCFDANKEYRGL